MRKSFLLNRLIYYPLVRKFRELVLSIKLLRKVEAWKNTSDIDLFALFTGTGTV